MLNMSSLSKRERQIMNIVFRLGEANAQQVTNELPEGTSQDSIRKLMKMLADKGMLTYERQGHSYCYSPAIGLEEAQKATMRGVVRDYFQNSAAQAVAAIINLREEGIDQDELSEIQRMIEKAEHRENSDD